MNNPAEHEPNPELSPRDPMEALKSAFSKLPPAQEFAHTIKIVGTPHFQRAEDGVPSPELTSNWVSEFQDSIESLDIGFEHELPKMMTNSIAHAHPEIAGLLSAFAKREKSYDLEVYVVNQLLNPLEDSQLIAEASKSAEEGKQVALILDMQTRATREDIEGQSLATPARAIMRSLPPPQELHNAALGAALLKFESVAGPERILKLEADSGKTWGSIALKIRDIIESES